MDQRRFCCEANGGGDFIPKATVAVLTLWPKPFARDCYDFWLGGDFIKNDEPQAIKFLHP
ncbi:MAG: hypothetical protein JKX72_11910 [Robiginitomaculum sp.]|nr:hypothetical protein [Robiginitomaculum sp.]